MVGAVNQKQNTTSGIDVAKRFFGSVELWCNVAIVVVNQNFGVGHDFVAALVLSLKSVGR